MYTVLLAEAAEEDEKREAGSVTEVRKMGHGYYIVRGQLGTARAIIAKSVWIGY